MNLKFLLSFIRTRSCYAYFVGLQLLVIVGLMTYDIIALVDQNPQMLAEPIIVIIELCITFLFFLELAFRLIAQNTKFFKNIWNIVDFTNFLLLIVLFILSFLYSGLERTQDIQIVPTILLGIRYAVQIVRGLMFLKQSHLIKQASMLDFEFTKDIRKDSNEEKPNMKMSLVLM